jgi:hypothetical protein
MVAVLLGAVFIDRGGRYRCERGIAREAVFMFLDRVLIR